MKEGVNIFSRRMRDRAVAEKMGYRVEVGFGEIDEETGKLMLTHGLKDYKESEACICERGLFRFVRSDTVGGGAWEEIPRFSSASDPSILEECMEWLSAIPGARSKLCWRQKQERWECRVHIATLSGRQDLCEISPVVGEAVTGVVLQVADKGQTLKQSQPYSLP